MVDQCQCRDVHMTALSVLREPGLVIAIFGNLSIVTHRLVHHRILVSTVVVRHSAVSTDAHFGRAACSHLKHFYLLEVKDLGVVCFLWFGNRIIRCRSCLRMHPIPNLTQICHRGGFHNCHCIQ